MFKAVLFILLFLALLWAVSEIMFLDVLGIGRLKAKKSFPEAAAKMGLTAVSPGRKKSFSDYSGTYGGYDIWVAPEMSSVKVNMPRIPGLFLNTFQKNISFDTGNQDIDRFFTARQAPATTAEKLLKTERFIRSLDIFIEKWKRKINKMDIEPGYIECRLKFGNGHYIPASLLEPMTSDLVGLADALQQSIGPEKDKLDHAKE